MQEVVNTTVLGLFFGTIGTTVGGIIGCTIKNQSNKFLSFMLSFAAGLMMAVICFDLIPESLGISKISQTIIGIFIGIIIMIICKYYDLKYEEINEFWKKRENSYLVTLLMKNFKCLNNNELRKSLGISNNKSLYNKVKIAEEKILINKRFREEYFELEEKIKENLKNA